MKYRATIAAWLSIFVLKAFVKRVNRRDPLEANAAMRSIVRRDTGESYQAFLTRLAQASGIETPTRDALRGRMGIEWVS